MAHHSVLVLDGNEFSTLAIVRSLGRQQLDVTVGAETDHHRPIARYSKYTKDFFSYPNPLNNADKFVDSIIEYLEHHAFDLVIPVTERTSLPLARRRAELERYSRLALPEYDVLEFASNKQQTFDLAQAEGIPVPQGIHIDDEQTLHVIAPTLSYPIVIKPSRSVADSSTTRVKLCVQYAFNADQLINIGLGILPHTPLILQEYFRGDGVGVEILANHGDILLAFQHRRLHELPLTGGGSCLRESVALDPQLYDYASRLIKRLNWHGVAMLEFKHNPHSGESRLMEINGRFWGSLPVAVDSGADFPYRLYRLLVHHDSSASSSHPRIGHINRKLKDDLYWYIVVLFRRETSPLVIWPTYQQLVKDTLSVFKRQHRFDSFAYDDPKPFMVDVVDTTIWFYHYTKEFISHRYWQAKFNRQKRQATVLQHIQSASNVLFICYGNINRSVLAEKCLRHYLPDSSTLAIHSAGFHPESHRPADTMMVDIAAKQGIDLTGWSSHSLQAQTVEQADIIFVMEIAHYRRLIEQFPKARHKTYLLGTVIDDHQQLPLEIADPYGQSADCYQQCFEHINRAARALSGRSNITT